MTTSNKTKDRHTRKKHPTGRMAGRMTSNDPLSLVQKKQIANQIRSYTHDEIVTDYQRLCDIGTSAKEKSNKNRVGNKVVDSFTFFERLNTVGKKGMNFYQLWMHRHAFKNKPYVRGFLRFSRDKVGESNETKMWYNLYRFYFSSINLFRPLVAMEYYTRYKPTCVLDFTMGWGGRLVGACALDVPKYIGIDQNKHLEIPYRDMSQFLRDQGTKTEMDLRFTDSLNVDYSKLDYDMVFTSPPYYNIEIYGGNVKPMYATKEEWDEQFYRPLFSETYKHMKRGGHYCLNIPNDVYERVCVPLFGKAHTKFILKKMDKGTKKNKRQNATQKKQVYQEYVYIWVGVGEPRFPLRPPPL